MQLGQTVAELPIGVEGRIPLVLGTTLGHNKLVPTLLNPLVLQHNGLILFSAQDRVVLLLRLLLESAGGLQLLLRLVHDGLGIIHSLLCHPQPTAYHFGSFLGCT